jgi:hypothetical protein
VTKLSIKMREVCAGVSGEWCDVGNRSPMPAPPASVSASVAVADGVLAAGGVSASAWNSSACTKFSISAQYNQYEAPHNTIYTMCGGGGGGDNSVTILCGGGSVKSVDTVCGGGDGKSVNTVCGGGGVRVWIQCAAAAVVRVCARRGGGGC